MSRFSLGLAVAVAGGALVGLSPDARATCAIPTAQYVSGSLYGAEVVAASACFSGTTVGGAGTTAAAIPLGSGTLAASADLSSGILTAYSSGGFASAAAWDTFTFSGLPSAGETISATLGLGGTFSGTGFGIAGIQAGPSAGFLTFGSGVAVQTASFGGGVAEPASVSVDVTVTDTSSLTVFGQIIANGSSNAIADLTDPPTLTLDLPAGVTATSASGVFTNFGPGSPVPEPAGVLLLLGGIGMLARARRRPRCR